MRYSIITVNIHVFSAIISFVTAANAVSFDGEITENRTIWECINGYKLTEIISDPKLFITTSNFAREEGYPAEEHVVLTDDGYILTLHRIPGKIGASPVFLQHPLACSSFDWLATGRGQALAFKLADAGYDVWLGNARGNTYSRCHTKYNTSSFEFWDFSWHEIGVHDLPAMISYVTKFTGQSVIYIGHSMGSTAFFVMSSERPDIVANVKLMIALAPIVYLKHSTSPVWMLAPFRHMILELLKQYTGTTEYMPSDRVTKVMSKYLCTLTKAQREICGRMAFFTIGFNPRQFNEDLEPRLFSHTPAGTSIKCMIHYAQGYISGRFQYYDHGIEKNWKLYKSIQPPDYDISKAKAPTLLIWSESDLFANPIDLMRLYKQLPNTMPHYRVDYPNFHHADFLYGTDAPHLVYDKVLSVMDNYK